MVQLPFFRVVKVPFVPQMEVSECGAACLAMVMSYYGTWVPLAEVREKCRVTRDGSSAWDLILGAKAYGFSARGYRIEMMDDLSRIQLPAILHWAFSHYVVLERISRAGAMIVDPSGGARHIFHSELDRNFTGIVLAITPSAKCKKRAKETDHWHAMLPMMRAWLPALLHILGISALLQFVSAALPIATQITLDWIIQRREQPLLASAAIALGVAVVVRAAGSVVRESAINRMEFVADLRLKMTCAKHLLQLPVGFFMHRNSGDLTDRVQRNSFVKSFLTNQIVRGISDGGLSVTYLILMYVYHPVLAFTVLASALAGLVIIMLASIRNRNTAVAEAVAESKEAGVLAEAFCGLETMAASKAEANLLRRWLNSNTARLSDAFKRQSLEISAFQITAALRGITVSLLFIIGTRDVIAGSLSIGGFAAFLALENLLIAPLRSFFSVVGGWQGLRVELLRWNDIMSAQPEHVRGFDPGRLHGEISVRQLSFRYSEGSPNVLTNIDLDIRSGEKVALVGPCGAGKSTLLRILLGLWPVSSGEIYVGGYRIEDLSLEALRRNIGPVLQELHTLFDDTIENNVSMLDPTIKAERIKAACRIACIADAVEALPSQYETRIGESGRMLSGGEKQRVCIARAIAKNPPILIFDEPTSAVDLRTDAIIQQNLLALDSTVIIVTHRLETIKHVDRIVVFKAGRVVQQGSYYELTNNRGPFREMLLGYALGSRV